MEYLSFIVNMKVKGDEHAMHSLAWHKYWKCRFMDERAIPELSTATCSSPDVILHEERIVICVCILWHDKAAVYIGKHEIDLSNSDHSGAKRKISIIVSKDFIVLTSSIVSKGRGQIHNTDRMMRWMLHLKRKQVKARRTYPLIHFLFITGVCLD